MKASLLFMLAALLLALPALWLLLRRQGTGANTAAALLLLSATASGYVGARLWQDHHLAATAQPFRLSAAAGHFQVITPAQLPAALAASQGRPVLLEFFADWCSSCMVWKNTVFNRSDVQTAMSPLVLLQIDATELTPDVQKMLDEHQLAGLPALLVYDRQGREQPGLLILGEMPAPEFIRWINTRALPAL
jgi:thiol:disulfide interchange protein DsbD